MTLDRFVADLYYKEEKPDLVFFKDDYGVQFSQVVRQNMVMNLFSTN